MKVFALRRLFNLGPWSEKKGWIGHILFWIILLAILVISDFNKVGWPLVFFQKSIDIAFYAAIIYINLLYLIPNFLSQKKFWTYVALLIVAVLILTPIKIAIQVMLFSDTPSFQNYFIENQSYFFN